MTRKLRQIVLASTAALLAIVLVAFLLRLDLVKEQERPDELAGALRWLKAHPSDWVAASIITHHALDSNLPQRFTLWREAHALATRLAPMRPNADAAFVRSGLFHWYELGAADRKAVLAAAVPLLRDPRVFESMYVGLWELTHDFALLRRASPGTKHALMLLRDLAVTNGLPAQYRELREEVRRRTLADFEARRAATPPHGELLMMLPEELHGADEPLVRALLAELQRRPLESAADVGRLTMLADYALRHELQPLDGLHALIRAPELAAPLRARLALRMGDPAYASQLELAGWAPGVAEWKPYQLDRARYELGRRDQAAARVHLDRAATAGHDGEVAAIAHALRLPVPSSEPRIPEVEVAGHHAWRGSLFTPSATTVPVRVDVVQSDQTAPYVELYVDDALVAEGDVRTSHTFQLPLGPGVHQVEARIANPRMQGGIQRRVRLAS